MTQYQDLIDKVRRCKAADNALDIAIDIALLEPDRRHTSVRANGAGTKLTYSRHGGGNDTHWARDHTLNAEKRSTAIALLLSLQSNEATNVEDK